MMMMVASRVLLLCLLCLLCCWVGGGESWDYNYCTEKDWVLLKSVLNKSDADIETHCSHNKTFVDLVTANITNAQADGKTTEQTTRGSPEGTTGINAGHSGTPNTASGAGVSSGPSPPQPGPSAPATQPASGGGAGERGDEGEPASVDPRKNSSQQEASDGSSGHNQSAHEVPPRNESTVHPDTATPSEKGKPPAEGSVSEDNDRAVPNTAPTTPSETVTESRSSTEVTNTTSAESSETNTSTTGRNVTQNADGSDIVTLWVGAYSLLLLFVPAVFASTVV